ncbi:MAG: cytochrome, partial [Frankiales bacterium]|nr:cytochrome [Frankiales bacterium]
ERMRPRVESLADQMADELGESFDLLGDYAEPMPVFVIADLLGVPREDHVKLRDWSQAIVHMYEPGVDEATKAAAIEASTAFADYVRAVVEQRRASPGEDLISDLIAARDDGSKLSDDELVASVVLLLNAGHEASVNVFGNGFHALLEHPDQLQRLRDDPGLLPTAIEELMRFDSPLQLFERTATENVEIGGVTVAAGQKIAALLGSANRDPAVFPDPDTLDVGRTDNPHISFGAGVHFCIGAPLARVELQASFGALLDRTSRLELGAPPTRRPEFVLRGLRELPVVLTP